MHHTNTNTSKPAEILASVATETADFILGALPAIGALAGIAGIFLVPLYMLARSVGAL